MQLHRVVYWITTVGITLIMLYSASMYFFNTEMIRGFFKALNYPEYLVIPLAVCKILAVVMINWRGVPWLTEWAYAGLFLDTILASVAHYHASHNVMFAVVAAILTMISYFLGKLVRPMYFTH